MPRVDDLDLILAGADEGGGCRRLSSRALASSNDNMCLNRLGCLIVSVTFVCGVFLWLRLPLGRPFPLTIIGLSGMSDVTPSFLSLDQC